jgi:hypothetical protein
VVSGNSKSFHQILCSLSTATTGFRTQLARYQLPEQRQGERRQTEQRRFARPVAFATSIFDSNKRDCWLKWPLLAGYRYMHPPSRRRSYHLPHRQEPLYIPNSMRAECIFPPKERRRYQAGGVHGGFENGILWMEERLLPLLRLVMPEWPRQS